MHRFIKAVGSGKKRARDLSRDEAAAAMALVLDGEARPEQVGAFLLALRMKGESSDELAGFVAALEASLPPGGARAPAGTLDVDAHGDGHAGRATLLPAAACAVAACGVPVLLRLQRESPWARHGLVAALAALGLDVARPLDAPRAARALATTRLAVLDLARYLPALERLVALRALLGVRTAAQTLMKLIDPLGAATRVVGVFHAPYLPSTAAALRAAGRDGLCVQSLGGLPEAAPGKVVRVCRAGAEPETIDLRPLAASRAARADAGEAGADGAEEAGADAAEDAAALNRAALDGEPAAVARAAATAALWLHAARGLEPLAAAEAARRALVSGDARVHAAHFADA